MLLKNDVEQDGYCSYVLESGFDLLCFDLYNGERLSIVLLGEFEYNIQIEISFVEVFDDGGRNMFF